MATRKAGAGCWRGWRRRSSRKTGEGKGEEKREGEKETSRGRAPGWRALFSRAADAAAWLTMSRRPGTLRGLEGAVAQLGERCNRTAEVRGSTPLSSTGHDNWKALPLGVTGNTPDSGSGESWFEPRRGNTAAESAAVFSCGLVLRGPLARSGSSPGGAMKPDNELAVVGLLLVCRVMTQ